MQRIIGVVWVWAVLVGGCQSDERAGRADDVDADAQDWSPADVPFETAEETTVELDVAEPEQSQAAEPEAEVAPEVVADVAVEVAPIDCGDCDDGLACTNDVCGADGVCLHNVKAGMCRVAGTCVESGHGPSPCVICAPDVNPNGLTSLTGGPCDDGDPCTSDEQCTLGQCGGGSERPCEASSPCHLSLGCDAVAGCLEEALPEGTPCGSGSACEAVAPSTVECVTGDGMPRGSVAWFDALRCPQGWAQYAPAIGRTLVPVGPLGPQSGVWQDGAALQTGEVPQHGHAVSGTADIATQRFAGIVGGGNGLAAPDDVAISGSVAPAALGLPYVQLLACEKTTDHVLGVAPGGVFVFATQALGCGADWVATDEGGDRLVVGVPTDGAAGGTFGDPPGLATRASHTHGVRGFVPVDSHGIALVSGCCSSDFASSSDPFVELVTGPPTSLEATTFPWRAELQCLTPRASVPGTPSDTAPPGIVLFADGDVCPNGWTPLESARGRLIVGAATGGDVGVSVGPALADREDRGHQHSVTLSLTLAQKNIAAANGPNQDGAAPGVHDLVLTSDRASSGLPFRQLLACTKP